LTGRSISGASFIANGLNGACGFGASAGDEDSTVTGAAIGAPFGRKVTVRTGFASEDRPGGSSARVLKLDMSAFGLTPDAVDRTVSCGTAITSAEEPGDACAGGSVKCFLTAGVDGELSLLKGARLSEAVAVAPLENCPVAVPLTAATTVGRFCGPEPLRFNTTTTIKAKPRTIRADSDQSVSYPQALK
jgi:hypothetical protein